MKDNRVKGKGMFNSERQRCRTSTFHAFCLTDITSILCGIENRMLHGEQKWKKQWPLNCERIVRYAPEFQSY